MTVGFPPAEGHGAATGRRASRRGAGGWAFAVGLLCAAIGFAVLQPGTAAAQTASFANTRLPKTDPNKKMLVTADELVYDYENDKISAVGNVQIYYDGSTLEAKRVTFDRKANTLRAEGDVLLKQPDGKVLTANTMQLTEDFRDGFLDSLRVDTPDKTHFAATRADRTDGNITVFQNGVYTACEPCKDHPEKPVLWQIKAARIVHNQNEQMIYYKDATLEFFGLPFAYFPYFSSPDPTVKRKTGFLMPEFYNNSMLGIGAGVPFFWNIAPDRDLTFDPLYFSKQGLLAKGEWRQRLIDGSYNIRAAGIQQQDVEQFAGLPGYRENRGMVQSSGNFVINSQWQWGWDGTLTSDRTFLRDYGLIGAAETEKISQAYLTGQGDRSFFDVRGMYFLGLSVTDNQDLIPVVGTFNYNYVFGNPIFGGEAGVKVNFNSVSRNEADFVGTSAATSWVGGATGIPPGSCLLSNPNPTQCLLRGAPGDYQRLSGEFYWKKTLTDAAGQMWTPFASARVDVAHANISALPSSYTDGPTLAGQNVLQSGNDDLIRAMPVIGLDYRYPFISVENWGTQTIEPRAQLIIRPNETSIGKFPNEDAQSLVFDDANLFSVSKYSGWDRVEGGSRLNVGVTYTAALNGAGVVSAVVGQSYSLFGKNSFAYGDMANTGLESGLETSTSDYVARFSYSPTNNLEFISRFRFDEANYTLQRLELEGRTSIDRLSVSATYGRYEPQPLLGYYQEREGVLTTASYKLTDVWSVSGGIRYNIAQASIDMTTAAITYADDCFTLALTYLSDYSINGPNNGPNNTVMLTIGLRTLGETKVRSAIGSSSTQ
ncbi:MAG: organic solvent tolerance protein [Rhizobiales bacterium 32-66-11]|nr:MAG: organic solvent tolerance protein [Rhizobiales bacterium 32-66-11]